MPRSLSFTCFFFFFNDTATTEIYTLSLHDALPICIEAAAVADHHALLVLRFFRKNDAIDVAAARIVLSEEPQYEEDRKSTRLNSSHSQISYAVFCLKKKKHPTSYN